MKELSIEEKAKRYDEALVRAKEMIKAMTNIGGVAKVDDIQHIFPELKMSKDEIGRRWLYENAKAIFETGAYREDEESDIKMALDWLEKQVQSNMGISEATKQKLEDNLNKALEKETPDSWNKFLDEQKPAWSEEDKEMSRFIGNAITADGASKYLESKGIQVIDAHVWLDGLKNRVQPQSKQEWSDDFEEEMDRYIEENFYGSAGCGFFSNRTKRELEAEDVVRIGCHFATWQKEQLKKSFNKQKQEWGEEDKNMLQSILDEYKSMAIEKRNWLKSLKHRVGCKANCITTKEWSEEDEDILNTIINHFKVDIECTDEDDTVRWLKSLKDRILPQQKQEWSEEDENNRTSALMLLKYPITIWDEVNNNTRIKAVDWLKSLKNKYVPQLKQDWSEEDESRRKKIIHILSLDGRIKNEELSDINSWLKSLRPQHHWKPSDEQMKALTFACIKNANIDKSSIKALYDLKEQLKKLRGE